MIFKYILMVSNFMQVQKIYRCCKVSYFQHVQRIQMIYLSFGFVKIYTEKYSIVILVKFTVYICSQGF
jgi:hypothetical protein